MTEPRAAASLCEEFLALNRQAFATGYYNTAYHTLAAALRAAHERQDAEGVARVERLAREQVAVMDAIAAVDEPSTQSAAAREHLSMFTLLVHEAHTMLLRGQHEPHSA
jgi:hypothetical protein